MSETNGNAAVAEHEAQQAATNRLKLDAAKLERRKTELLAPAKTRDGSDRTTQAAVALLDGDETEPVSDRQEEIAEVSTRLRVVRRAIEIQKQRKDRAAAARDAAVIEEARPAVIEAAELLGTRVVGVQDAAEALHDLVYSFRAEGVSIPNEWRLRLNPLSARDEYSRSNALLDELEEIGAKIDRSSRDAAELEREAARLAESRRRAEAGGAIYAGPEGTGDVLRGGQARPMGVRRRGVKEVLVDARDAIWGRA